MNLRLISPEVIVDIGELTELRGIAVNGDLLTIGALTRHVDVLKSPVIAAHAALLRDAISHVAHPAIRNRGTLGGSLAHADPASELPACMVVLEATIVVRGLHGECRIPANEFFTGIYETVLSPQELIVAIEVPVARTASTHFFHEFARRHGDYAIVGLAARAIVRREQFDSLRLGFFAVGDRPLLAAAAGKLTNATVTAELLASASAALSEELAPQEDQQATPAMRRHLAKVLLSRCVSTLLSRPDLLAGAVA
jgi:carbon-monoxide dehydrogenase medium subunit